MSFSGLAVVLRTPGPQRVTVLLASPFPWPLALTLAMGHGGDPSRCSSLVVNEVRACPPSTIASALTLVVEVCSAVACTSLCGWEPACSLNEVIDIIVIFDPWDPSRISQSAHRKLVVGRRIVIGLDAVNCGFIVTP